MHVKAGERTLQTVQYVSNQLTHFQHEHHYCMDLVSVGIKCHPFTVSAFKNITAQSLLYSVYVIHLTGCRSTAHRDINALNTFVSCNFALRGQSRRHKQLMHLFPEAFTRVTYIMFSHCIIFYTLQHVVAAQRLCSHWQNTTLSSFSRI